MRREGDLFFGFPFFIWEVDDIKAIWKDIKGFEGFYQVSSDGEIRSLDRINEYGRRLKGKVLRPGKTVNGYLFVALSMNGVIKNVRVHRVVAETFLPITGECVNHLDGIKENNCVENLQWCSQSENWQHAVSSGLAVQRGTPKPVRITDPTGYSFVIDSMLLASKFFGFKKCWLQNRVRKNGKRFKYRHHLIEVVS